MVKPGMRRNVARISQGGGPLSGAALIACLGTAPEDVPKTHHRERLFGPRMVQVGSVKQAKDHYYS